MKQQVNLRIPGNLRKQVEKYAKKHGFRNIQELAQSALREKIMEEDSVKETLDIMSDKKLYRSILRSMEDVKAGRVYIWEDLQEAWKKKHGKK